MVVDLTRLRSLSAEMEAAYQPSRVSLEPQEEAEFQKFWAEDAAVQDWRIDLMGGDVPKSPDDPQEQFDYRKAWKAGDRPEIVPDKVGRMVNGVRVFDDSWHWGSTGKDRDHPTYHKQFLNSDDPQEAEMAQALESLRARRTGGNGDGGNIDPWWQQPRKPAAQEVAGEPTPTEANTAEPNEFQSVWMAMKRSLYGLRSGDAANELSQIYDAIEYQRKEWDRANKTLDPVMYSPARFINETDIPTPSNMGRVQGMSPADRVTGGAASNPYMVDRVLDVKTGEYVPADAWRSNLEGQFMRREIEMPEGVEPGQYGQAISASLGQRGVDDLNKPGRNWIGPRENFGPTEGILATESNRKKIRTARYRQVKRWAGILAENEELKNYIAGYYSKGYKDFMADPGFVTFFSNPIEIITTITGESAAPMAVSVMAGMIGKAAGGLPGIMGGQFAASHQMEYGAHIVHEMLDHGYDATNPKQVRQFFRDMIKDPKLWDQVKSDANAAGVIVGSFDAITAGLAGQFAKMPMRALNNFKKSRVVTKAGLEMALQMSGGGMGEAAKQFYLDGEVTDGMAIFHEIIAEIGTTPAEVATAVYGVSDARVHRSLGKEVKAYREEVNLTIEDYAAEKGMSLEEFLAKPEGAEAKKLLDELAAAEKDPSKIMEQAREEGALQEALGKKPTADEQVILDELGELQDQDLGEFSKDSQNNLPPDTHTKPEDQTLSRGQIVAAVQKKVDALGTNAPGVMVYTDPSEIVRAAWVARSEAERALLEASSTEAQKEFTDASNELDRVLDAHARAGGEGLGLSPSFEGQRKRLERAWQTVRRDAGADAAKRVDDAHDAELDAQVLANDLRRAGPSVEAATRGGTVYLRDGAFRNADRVAQVFDHEVVGHVGTEEVLGKMKNRFYARVASKFLNDPDYSDIVDGLVKNYLSPEEQAAWAAGEKLPIRKRMELAKEFVAKLSENLDSMRTEKAKGLAAWARKNLFGKVDKKIFLDGVESFTDQQVLGALSLGARATQANKAVLARARKIANRERAAATAETQFSKGAVAKTDSGIVKLSLPSEVLGEAKKLQSRILETDGSVKAIGEESLHVTLVNQKFSDPERDYAVAPPNFPITLEAPQKRTDGKKASWYSRIREQEQMRTYQEEIHGEPVDPDREFHVSLANATGNPRDSLAYPHKAQAGETQFSKAEDVEYRAGLANPIESKVLPSFKQDKVSRGQFESVIRNTRGAEAIYEWMNPDAFWENQFEPIKNPLSLDQVKERLVVESRGDSGQLQSGARYFLVFNMAGEFAGKQKPFRIPAERTSEFLSRESAEKALEQFAKELGELGPKGAAARAAAAHYNWNVPGPRQSKSVPVEAIRRWVAEEAATKGLNVRRMVRTKSDEGAGDAESWTVYDEDGDEVGDYGSEEEAQEGLSEVEDRLRSDALQEAHSEWASDREDEIEGRTNELIAEWEEKEGFFADMDQDELDTWKNEIGYPRASLFEELAEEQLEAEGLIEEEFDQDAWYDNVGYDTNFLEGTEARIKQSDLVVQYEEYTMEGDNDDATYYEAVYAQPTWAGKNPHNHAYNEFSQDGETHSDLPFWVRGKDKYDIDGVKGRFIEEFQSDEGKAMVALGLHSLVPGDIEILENLEPITLSDLLNYDFKKKSHKNLVWVADRADGKLALIYAPEGRAWTAEESRMKAAIDTYEEPNEADLNRNLAKRLGQRGLKIVDWRSATDLTVSALSDQGSPASVGKREILSSVSSKLNPMASKHWLGVAIRAELRAAAADPSIDFFSWTPGYAQARRNRGTHGSEFLVIRRDSAGKLLGTPLNYGGKTYVPGAKQSGEAADGMVDHWTDLNNVSAQGVNRPDRSLAQLGTSGSNGLNKNLHDQVNAWLDAGALAPSAQMQSWMKSAMTNAWSQSEGKMVVLTVAALKKLDPRAVVYDPLTKTERMAFNQGGKRALYDNQVKNIINRSLKPVKGKVGSDHRIQPNDNWGNQEIGYWMEGNLMGQGDTYNHGEPHRAGDSPTFPAMSVDFRDKKVRDFILNDMTLFSKSDTVPEGYHGETPSESAQELHLGMKSTLFDQVIPNLPATFTGEQFLSAVGLGKKPGPAGAAAEAEETGLAAWARGQKKITRLNLEEKALELTPRLRESWFMDEPHPMDDVERYLEEEPQIGMARAFKGGRPIHEAGIPYRPWHHDVNPSRYGINSGYNVTLDGGENYTEAAVAVTNPGRVKYTGAHFNVQGELFHIRFDQRRSGHGRALLIQEIQSDFHQGAKRLRDHEVEKLAEEATSERMKDFEFDGVKGGILNARMKLGEHNLTNPRYQKWVRAHDARMREVDAEEKAKAEKKISPLAGYPGGKGAQGDFSAVIEMPDEAADELLDHIGFHGLDHVDANDIDYGRIDSGEDGAKMEFKGLTTHQSNDVDLWISRWNERNEDPDLSALENLDNPNIVSAIDWERSAEPSFEQDETNAPFRKNWSLLALKYAIQLAKLNGLDRVAWLDGMAHNERYDKVTEYGLAETGGYLEYDQKNAEGFWTIYPDGKQYRKAEVYDDKEIAFWFGAEVLAKMKDGVERVKLPDGGVKVGEMPFINFYDRDLVNKANKLLKSTGVKVRHETGILETATGLQDEGIHYIDLTEEVRRATDDMTLYSKTSASPVVPQTRARKEARKKTNLPTRVAKHLTPTEAAKPNKTTSVKLVDLFDKLPSVREMAAVAEAGQAKRGWYEGSVSVLLEIFEDDAPRFAALLAALSPQTSVESNLFNALAVWKNWLSAGRPRDKRSILRIMAESVESTPMESRPLDNLQKLAKTVNLAARLSGMARRKTKTRNYKQAWADYRADKTKGNLLRAFNLATTAWMGMTDAQRKSMQAFRDRIARVSVMDAWENNSVRALQHDYVKHGGRPPTISGPKVNSFMLNLMGVAHEVTNDTWMAIFAAIDQKLFEGGLNAAGQIDPADPKADPGKGFGYLAFTARVRATATYLTKLTGKTWTPAEVQETIWSWAKVLYEMATEGKTPLAVLESGEITDEKVGEAPDFAQLFKDEPRYTKLLKDAGYGQKITSLTTGRDDGSSTGDLGFASGEAGSLARDIRKGLLAKSARRIGKVKKAREAKAAAKARARSKGETQFSKQVGLEEGPIYTEADTLKDGDGNAITFYRGEHGDVVHSSPFDATLIGTPAFTAEPRVANTYAAAAEGGRVGAYRLRMKNPWVVDEETTGVMDAAELKNFLGPRADRVFAWIKATQEEYVNEAWMDPEVGDYVTEVMDPEDDWYTEIYHLLNQPVGQSEELLQDSFLEVLKEMGYDGVIFPSMFAGEGANQVGDFPIEYRPFYRGQIVSAFTGETLYSKQVDAPDPATGRGKLSVRVLEDDRIPDSVKGKVKVEYEVLGNQVVLDQAMEIFNEGHVVARSQFEDMSNDLTPAVRGMLGQVLVLRASANVRLAESLGRQDLADKRADAAADLANSLSQMGREWGQGVQILSAFSLLDPFSLRRLAKKEIAKAQRRKMAGTRAAITGRKGAENAADQAADILEDAQDGAAKRATNTTASRKRIASVVRRDKRSDKSVWGRYRDETKSKILSIFNRSFAGVQNPHGKGKPALAEFTFRLMRHAREKLRQEGVSDERTGATKENNKAMLKDLLENPEKYDETWEVVGRELIKTYEGDPETLAAVTAVLGKITFDKASDKVMVGIVKEELAEMQLRLDELARSHFTKQDATEAKLKARIMAELGLTESGAAELARTFSQSYKALLKNEAKRQLDAMVLKASSPKVRRALKTQEQKIIALANLGAFSREDVYNAVAQGLGLPEAYDAAWLNRLGDLADQIQRAPEGFQREDLNIKLLNMVANKVGDNVVDIMFAFRYANMLSGFSTQEINIASNFVQLALSGSTLALRSGLRPAALFRIFAGMSRGLATGFREGVNVLATGRGRKGIEASKFQVDPVLERVRFTGGKVNPMNWMKGVTRALASMDAFFRFANLEMYSEFLAWQLAKKQGLSGEELTTKVEEILKISESDRAEAATQAETEGLEGRDVKRRQDEIMLQKRDVDIQAETQQFALESVFQQTPDGVIGVVASMLNWAIHPRLTPGERLGPARWMGQKIGQVFVPFVNTIANVANTAIEYTPGLGTMRIALSAHANSKTKEQLNNMLMRNLQGTILMAALEALFLEYEDDDEPEFAITGSGPKDWQDRKILMETTAWRPWTITIFGTQWNYGESPLAIPLAFLGGYHDARKYGDFTDKELGTRLASGALVAGQSLFDQTFLRGGQDLFDILRGDERAGRKLFRLAKDTSASFVIPNIINQVDKMFDPTKYSENELNGAWARSVWFARRKGYPDLNIWGQPSTRFEGTLGERFLDRLEKATGEDDPLMDQLIKNHYIPRPPSKSTRVLNKEEGRSTLELEEAHYLYSYYLGREFRRRLENYSADGKLFDAGMDGIDRKLVGKDLEAAEVAAADNFAEKADNQLSRARKAAKLRVRRLEKQPGAIRREVDAIRAAHHKTKGLRAQSRTQGGEAFRMEMLSR